MRTTFLAVAALAAVLTSALWAQSQAGARPWIHIQVDPAGGDGARVHVNVPLSMARTLFSMAGDDNLQKVHVGAGNTELSNLRKLWDELKKSPDSRFVTVEEKDQVVRMEKRQGRLLITVDGSGEKPERVRLNLPVTLVDELLSGSGNELNLAGAIDKLSAERGDLIQVEDGKSTVRIWIDEQG